MELKLICTACFLTNFELKRLFYTIVVGVTFSVNVFNDSIFKLDIFGL